MLAILLSTYNGEKYLREQIDSILQQDFHNLDLYIRDDGSKDSTKSIIQYYASHYPNIHFLQDTNNLGAALSFMALLKYVDSEYYMFCDQDDVWLQDKVSKSILKIKEVEQGRNLPSLVFSDAKVVDEKLNILSNSFWNYNKAFPQILLSNPEFINVFNCSPGCTMIFNHELKKYLTDYHSNILMHDWYIMIKSFQNGTVDYINEPLMLYRQHAQNVVGADKISIQTFFYRIFSFQKTIKEQLKTFRFVTGYTHINFLKYYILKFKFNCIRLKKVFS